MARLILQAETHWSEIDGHYSLPITHAEQIIVAALQREVPVVAGAVK